MTALIIIFNHRYDKNIPILRDMYKGKYSAIRFLVPFYDGNDEDVIPVYEESYNFEGYIAQAMQEISELGVSHYLFIGDDLLLNPLINENNISSFLNIRDGDGYIESIELLKEMSNWYYDRFDDAYRSFVYNNSVNYKPELPTIDYASEKARSFGFDNWQLIDGFKYKKYGSKKMDFLQKIRKLLFPIHVDYPLFAAYSDFFVVPHNKLEQFGRICGIFAAMRLFAEIAIPTAFVLSFNPEQVKTQLNIKYKTEKMWIKSQFVTEFEEKCEFKTCNIPSNWPQEYIYLHPVKLSRWK